MPEILAAVRVRCESRGAQGTQSGQGVARWSIARGMAWSREQRCELRD
jgi:hypothetical protein